MTSESYHQRFNGEHPDFKVWNDFFHKFGFIIIDNALPPEVVRGVRADLVRMNSSVRSESPIRHVMHKCFFSDSVTTVKIVENSLISDFAQYVIRGGPEIAGKQDGSLQMHLIHNNAFTVPAGGRGQAPSWHTDDPMQQIILPKDVELPSYVKLPVLVATYMIWLSDCSTPANGPTHVVPGSHRFGRNIETDEDREFAEKHAFPACGKAGTAVLVNSQLWHRGAENTSDMPRDTLQLTFGRRIISHMFGSIMDYSFPKHVFTKLSAKGKKLFGYLKGGAYS